MSRAQYKKGRWISVSLTRCASSLEKDGDRRATPWHILGHPWMVEMKTKRVDMVQFLKKVWDWQD